MTNFRKKLFLIVLSLGLLLTFAACSLESKVVDLGVTVNYRPEMLEGDVQKVELSLTDYAKDEMKVSATTTAVDVVDITCDEDITIKALAGGEAEIIFTIVTEGNTTTTKVVVKVIEKDYSIAYQLNGGENAEANLEGYVRSLLPLELQPATKQGYKFLGWELNGEVVSSIPVGTTGDVELSAKWELVEHTITYDLDGGVHEEGYPTEFSIESGAVALKGATKEGYKFLGWFVGEEKIESIPADQASDVTVVAHWEYIPKEFAVTYVLDGGTNPADAISKYVEGTALVLPTPTKEGYNFLGWYVGDVKVTEITGNVELTAKWELITFVVKYDLSGGVWEGQFSKMSDFAVAFVADFNHYAGATRTTVAEFHTTTHPEIKTAFASSEMLAKYQWLFQLALEELTANFAKEGNEGYADIKAESLELATKLAAGDTTAIGGSYANGRSVIRHWLHGLLNVCNPAAVEFYTPISTDFSLEANQAKFFAAYVKAEEELAMNAVLPTPVKSGYTFLGWYEGETKVEKATKDMSVVAKWEVVKVMHNLTLDLAGGVLAEEAPKQFEEGVGLATLPTPTKEGFEFLGWFEGETVVTGVAATVASDVTLVAHWKEVIPPATEYEITYNLDGGNWADSSISNQEELKAAFFADMVAYMQSLGWSGTAINMNEDLRLDAEGKAMHEDDFMGVTYAYRDNMEAFFQNEKYAAKWGWMYDYITATGTALTSTTLIRANIHAFIYQSEWASWPYSYNFSSLKFDDFKDKIPAGEKQVGPAKYEVGKVVAIPAPAKEGFIFVEWQLNGVKFEGVTETTIGNLELTAKWRKDYGDVTVIEVGPEATYKTLAEALVVAQEGSVIKVAAGTYEGAVIEVAGIKLEGPNAGVNPNTATRQPEAIFTTDITVKADSVTIDGIQITGAARIVGAETGTKDTTIQNVYSYVSTVNPEAANSTTAPIHFATTAEGAQFENLVLANLKYEGSTGRPMIFYGMQIVGLTIKDSVFLGTRQNYNDGIKFDNLGSFGVKGDVTITGNTFENYSQYVMWFREFAEGNYTIENNIYKTCGQTAGSHAAANFISYVGAEGGKVAIRFQYNTVENSYILVRIDANASLVAGLDAKVSYNKMFGCATSTVYVLNKNTTIKIDATNNYYDKAPVAGVFTNATWEPFYANEDDVPVYGQPLNFFGIEYDLQGGVNAEAAPTSYDSNVGLAVLPTPTNGDLVFVGWYMEGVKVDSIAANHTGKVTLTAKWREDALYVGTSTESYYYATLALALAAAKQGDKIILDAGTYAEDVTISVADLTIAGPNALVNPNTGTRALEAELTGKVTINKAATGLTIEGLAFSGAATITGGQVIGLSFVNNYVHDTAEAATAWAEGSGYKEGFMYLCGATGTECQNLVFINNKFDNVSNVNINISYSMNVTFDGNVFKNFDRDAVRFNNGGYNYGVLAFTNNEFLQDTLGGYNGIYFRIYGGPGIDDTVILIEGNKFVNIGKADAGLYSGAISARNYQEKGAEIVIKNNEFNKCVNFIRIRNNGTAANHAISNWSCLIENNIFKGVPSVNYFANFNATDKAATNPENTVFGANYYEDNDGVVITDMAVLGAKMLNCKEKGSALAEKPVLTAAEPVVFYTINYVLDGGTAAGLVTSYNRLTGAIALPTPTWNIYHEFVEWQINGVKVTEIAEGTKGDVEVVAVWKEIEGNPRTINFELNGGNWSYDSFDDISADLLKDYNTYGGTNYNTDNLPKGAWENINLHSFFYSSGMKAKWSWLCNYLGEVGGAANKAGCALLPQKNSVEEFDAVNSNYKYAVSYELRAFMFGGAMTSNANYKSSDYADTTVREKVWAYVNAAQSTELLTTEGKEVTLPVPHKPYLSFVGWYDNAEFTGSPVTKVTLGATDPTYYAKYEDLNPVTEVKVTNGVASLKRFETLQLVCEVLPTAAANKVVKYVSSDKSVLTVTSDGLVTAVANGQATITVTSSANDKISTQLTITVVSPNYIDAEFKTTSYVVVGQSIEVLARISGTSTGTITWESKNPDVATVENGVVTGVKAGSAVIKLVDSSNAETNLEITVVVLAEEPTGIEAEAYKQSNANVFLRPNLGIGAGTPVYYMDILGSVSKILFEEYVVDEKYAATQAANDKNHGGAKSSTEFITVHYTGNMSKTASAAANASYFANETATSIHYVTGNDGIYHVLDDSLIGFHAGDGTSVTFEWIATGVKVSESDPERPVFGINADSKFTINGKDTSVSVPTGTKAGTEKVTDSKWINDQGLASKVVDGEYYMGTTWWCYSQIAEGRICNKGGNLNSIGIESAVNEGTDLWYTWQKTAQLVAHLMLANNLDITRVVGHHFFSAKDCPQPLLENNLEIWWKFIEMVEYEYEMLTTYNGYKVTCVSNNPSIVDNTGRVISQPEFTTCVTYTLTFTKGEEVKTVTMSAIVPGIYEN